MTPDRSIALRRQQQRTDARLDQLQHAIDELPVKLNCLIDLMEYCMRVALSEWARGKDATLH